MRDLQLIKSTVLLLGLISCAPRAAQPDATAAAAQSASHATVTLERMPCFGRCPTYRVQIDADGGVSFTGRANVDSTGARTGRADPAKQAALLRLMDSVYFALEDGFTAGAPSCRPYIADMPRVITSMTTPTRARTIEHDLGCPSVPRLNEIERRIEEAADVRRWIGDRR